MRTLKKLLNNKIITIDEYEPKYKRLLCHQASVGWEQILKGRFVLEWSELIDDYIASLNVKPSKSFSGDIWVIGISKLILNYAWNV